MSCESCFKCEACVACERYGPPVRTPIVTSSLTVFPTNRCNLRCKYCFIYNYERQFGKTVDMSLETAKKMIFWLMSANSDRANVHWFGGEPLVAFPLIKEATEWGSRMAKGCMKELRWGITSNMTLIDDEVNEFLRKYDYNVLCSIDGPQKYHDANRVYPDGSGSWEDAMAGLERVLKWRKGVTVRYTITPETVKGVWDGTRLFLDLGIKSVAHEFVYEVTWPRRSLTELKRQLLKLVPLVVESPSLQFKPFRDGLRSFMSERRMTDRCGLARGDFGVDVDGNLFRCHRFVDQWPHHLGSVWTGLDVKKANIINRNWDVGKVVAWDGNKVTCLYCPARMGCNAGCLAVNYDTTGYTNKPPKSYCDIARLKVDVACELLRELKRADVLELFFKTMKGGECR